MSRFGSLLALAVLALSVYASASEGTELKSGYKAVLELGGKDVHTYTVRLTVGQSLEAVALQQGVDLVVEVLDPKGKLISQVDSPNGTNGPEPVSVFATVPGIYTLRVKALDPGAPKGKYEMSVTRLLSSDEVALENAETTYGNGAVLDLWKAYRSGGKVALERFLRDASNQYPKVEPVEGRPDLVNVTFLYTGAPEVTSVQLLGGPFAFAPGVPMTRFEDTDLWVSQVTMPSDGRFTYSYRVSTETRLDEGGGKSLLLRNSAMLNDPFNPKRFGVPSLLVLPDAPAQPYIVPPTGHRGKMEPKSIRSSVMKEDRAFGVYTPPSYDGKGKPCKILISFDGEVYGSAPAATLIPIPTILDNLIDAGKVAPTVAILVNGQGQRQRDLTCNDKFVNFLVQELLPWVRQHYNVSAKPEDVVVTGSSFGGICSAYCALTHPEVFGNVLSQSGSYWFTYDWQSPNKMPYLPGDSLLIEKFRDTPKLPVRFWMEVGRFETATMQMDTNRQLRDILRLKGYDVTYSEFSGGHDYVCWRGSIADGLIKLIGKP